MEATQAGPNSLPGEMPSMCGYNRTLQTGSFLQGRNLFFTVLEMGKFRFKVLTSNWGLFIAPEHGGEQERVRDRNRERESKRETEAGA